MKIGKIKKDMLKVVSRLFFGLVLIVPMSTMAYNGNRDFEKVIHNMADPTILKISDNEYYVTGTGRKGIDIYKSTDLKTFTHFTTYSPWKYDEYNYCWIWAPDLSKKGDVFTLIFSVLRIGKNEHCNDHGKEMVSGRTSYEVKSTDLKGFKKMKRMSYKVGKITYGSTLGGGENNILVDAAIEDGRLFYNWHHGDKLSSIKIEAPRDIIRHTNVIGNEGVNEGPGLFTRDKIKYLFFSRYRYTGSYTSSYMYGGDVYNLKRMANNVFDFTNPIQSDGCKIGEKRCIFENAGHGDVTSRNGQYYYVYLKSYPKEAEANKKIKRSTFVTPMYFKENGKIVNLTKTSLRWRAKGSGYKYTLDLRLKDGSWVWGCKDMGASTSIQFNGLCDGQDNRVVHKGEIGYYRISYHKDGVQQGYEISKSNLENDEVDFGKLTENKCAIRVKDNAKEFTSFIESPGMNKIIEGDNIVLEATNNKSNADRYIWFEGGYKDGVGSCDIKKGKKLYDGPDSKVTISVAKLLNKKSHNICLSVRRGGAVSKGGEWNKCKEAVVVYTYNKKRSNQIPDNCKIWFDGCNTCTRNSEGGVMGCTKKACKLSPDTKAYCKEYFTNTSTDKKITADVNQDGKITVVDAVLTLKKSVGYKITDLKNMGWNDTSTTGDVNCDNKVTVVDAVLLLKKSVGYKTEDLKDMGWCVE